MHAVSYEHQYNGDGTYPFFFSFLSKKKNQPPAANCYASSFSSICHSCFVSYDGSLLHFFFKQSMCCVYNRVKETENFIYKYFCLAIVGMRVFLSCII